MLDLVAKSRGTEARSIVHEPAQSDRRNHYSCIFFLTWDCNLRCRYCYEKSKKRRSMPLNVATDAIKFFMEFSDKLHLQFFGGEPLLEFQLMQDITEHLRQHYANRYSFSIFTNGTLLDENVLDFFCENRVHVTLSIDGPQTVHDLNRVFPDGSGTFDIIAPKLVKLDRKRTRIRLTVTPNNVAHLFESINFFYDQGFLDIQEEIDRFAKWQPDAIEVLLREYRRIGEFLIEHYSKGDFRWPNYERQVFPFVSPQNNRRGRCGSTEGMCSMDVNGDLYPCQKFIVNERLKIGNIYEGFNQEQRNIVAAYRLPDYLAETRKCRSCQFVGSCFAGCIADNIIQDTDQVQDCVFRKVHREMNSRIYDAVKGFVKPPTAEEIAEYGDCGGETGGCGGERGCGGEDSTGDGCGGENCSYF